MRWFWIDRFTEFVSGEYAVAIKNVSLGEEHLHGNYDSYPMLPHSIIVEGMAQTAGMLVSEATQFSARLVLAKVTNASFHFPARPGDTVTYRTDIENRTDEGVLIRATSHVGDRRQADVEFYLAILGDKYAGRRLFEPAHFGRLLRVLRVYDVGVTRDGRPLEMPPHLLEWEQAPAQPSSVQTAN